MESINAETFHLGMLGTALKIEGPAEWIAPLQRVWSTWTPPSVIDPWLIKIVADPALPPPEEPLFETLPLCRGGLCTFAAAGFVGQIESENGVAYLHAHPTAQTGDIGYFLRVALALQAFWRGGILFHAAGIVHKGQGFAFFGLSGSGKTTAATLSAPDPVLNDDLLLLWPTATGWQMHSTPFGKRRGSLHVAPLRACIRLRKDTQVFLEPFPNSRAIGELVANTPILSGDALCLPTVLTRWETLLAQLPAYALHFRREPTFWEVIDDALG